MAGTNRTSLEVIQVGELPVIYESLDYLRSVIVGAWVEVGARHERPAEHGFSHFVEHMVFKGTPTRQTRGIAQALEFLGGELNAFTAREYSCFYARAASCHISTAMEVLADIVLNSTFPANEYEREQGVVLEEIRMYEDSPEELSHELLQEDMFSAALGHPIVGSVPIIGRAPRDKVYEYYKRMYAPGRIFLTVLGNVSRAELDRELRHFAPLVKGPAQRRLRLQAPRLGGGRRLVRKPIEQLHMCFGVEGLPMTHKDRYSLHLLNTYLGGGMSSRLFQEIREKRGLAYNVYSFVQSFHDAGLWGFYCGCSAQNGAKVRKILIAELERLGKRGLGARTVRQLKDQMKGSLMLGMEKTSFRMTRLAMGRMYFNDVVSVDQVIEQIEAVTPDDVARVAAQLLTGEFAGATAVGPVPEGKEADVLGGPPTSEVRASAAAAPAEA